MKPDWIDKKYSCLYLDPPWTYKDKLDHSNMRGAAEDHYSCITVDGLKDLPIQSLAKESCLLFLWTTGPFFADGTATDIIRSWGFSPSTVAFVWVKCCKKKRKPCGCLTPRMGLGRYTRSESEFVLVGKRGRVNRQDAGVRQVVHSPLRKHSAKPPEVRQRIDRLVGDVNKLELFAREKADGWEATGLELDGDGFDIRELHRYV